MYQIFNSQTTDANSQMDVNPSLPEVPNYPVPNPSVGGSGETIAIIMAMTIFGSVVKKLVA